MRWLWLAGFVLVLGWIIVIALPHWDALGHADGPITRAIVGLRSAALTDVAKALNALTLYGVVLALRIATAAVLIATKRWRQLVVFLATFVIEDWVVLHLSVVRPMPTPAPLVSVSAITFPSRSLSSLSVTLFSMVFVLAPAGRARNRARDAAIAVVTLVGLAQVYLGVAYMADAVYAAVLGATVTFVAFKTFVPDESFPVIYGSRGTTAHLDLGGKRAEAITQAMRDEVGLEVTEVKPFGLVGSGGSSPLRMTTAAGEHVFGKIYATSHARSDRWYRIGRTILYGQLEDETPFGTPRRLATYEDYSLRLLADSGVRVAKTYGVVELTPNQEYMLVTEFFEGAHDLDTAIDDTVIDEGLRLVRTFWDAGVAHRDIKPANLLVRDGHLQLVDVSGLEVRPSPWRQAVDLANMMLTLALQSDPEHVYLRALAVFDPDEIAEAFASAVGLAIPTQLAAKLKEDGRPLIETFKQLAPPHPPVSIQRWSARRLVLAAAAVAGALALVAMFVDSLRAGLA